jgi:hypothetical protein
VGLLAVIASPPLALDGESVTSNNTGLAILSLLSIVIGYGVIAGLWYFVFRDRSRKHKRDSSD